MTDYSQLLIKQYKYWGLYVHENQCYLGRCVIWCDREDAQHLTDMTKEESDELLIILKNLKNALEKNFSVDWPNFAFLGNETRHLHGHFVPRYSSDREFGGYTFTDNQWGHNWVTDKSFTIPRDILMDIKNTIRDSLE